MHTATSRERRHRPAKRAVDLLLGVPALVLTIPIVIVAALAIWISGGRPVFLRRQRLGKDGERFEMLTLRTATIDDESVASADASAPMAPPASSVVDRIVQVTSIDELPKLWNVVRGEMSLVGPPPVPPSYAEHTSDDLDARLSVPPGMIGRWPGPYR
jgi:lipopolysaccharide/colanic/teichoic acid biosynthesis glycosyltransferase